MHDFSKWSGLIVLQPKQKYITGTFFSKISLTTKTRFRCCLLTMVKNKIKNKKKVATGVNYIPRAENSEKRYKKRKCYHFNFKQKKFAGNVCQNNLGKTFKWNVKTFERS